MSGGTPYNRRMKVRALLAVLLLVCPAVFARRQAAQPPAPAAHAFQNEFVADLDELQQKFTELATSVPAGRYGWRPAEGVRSIGEVYMHVAGSNYFLASFAGAKPPSDIPADIEKITDKQRVLAEMQKSFAFVRALAKNTPDADLDKPVAMFGKPTTCRAVLMTILNHLHEHLGQSVAYARMNGVVPPWSR